MPELLQNCMWSAQTCPYFKGLPKILTQVYYNRWVTGFMQLQVERVFVNMISRAV